MKLLSARFHNETVGTKCDRQKKTFASRRVCVEGVDPPQVVTLSASPDRLKEPDIPFEK
jgi:hypothetical protein